MKSFSIFGLAAGFFIGMILMELLLEFVTASAQHKFVSSSSLPAAITLSQFAGCFALPILIKPDTRKSINLTSRSMGNYLILAVLIFGATGLATASLSYVAYPVKIVFKSTKLIPTMMVSYLFSGKVYSVLDYASAGLLCIGTALFVYHPSNAPAGESSSMTGVALLVCSVVCDAFVPNVQKSIMNYTGAEELMANSNLIGLIAVTSYMVVQGGLADVIAVVSSDAQALSLSLSLIGVGLTLAVSVYCYTNLIKVAGPVVAVGVATTRKVASIICTYVIFPKPLSKFELLALGLIITGISVEYLKSRHQQRSIKNDVVEQAQPTKH